MKLAECQEQFWRLATRADEERDAGRILVGTDELGAEERIRIYANMFIWRQIDALREDFPKLAALLGDEGFYQVAERYLAAHPSTHPSLSRLGDGLPTWLDQDQGRIGHQLNRGLKAVNRHVRNEVPSGLEVGGAQDETEPDLEQEAQAVLEGRGDDLFRVRQRPQQAFDARERLVNRLDPVHVVSGLTVAPSW